MGCLGLLMFYYLVGGRWGTAARPLLECGRLRTPDPRTENSGIQRILDEVVGE
jgi:hypothetical protein